MLQSPVSALSIAEEADLPNENADAISLAYSLDHVVIPKYASAAARDVANAHPVANDLCSIGTAGFYYYDGTAWQPVGATRRAFRTTSLSIGTTKTTYCSIPTVVAGTYHVRAMMAITQTVSALVTAELDFNGSAGATPYQTRLINATTNSSGWGNAVFTSLGIGFGSSAVARNLFTVDGIIVVTASGTLTWAATCATTARTADAGGYLIIQKWA